ncbi:BTAD domain-containing putative transcriptional regulator [Micromonospora coxensis]|uniref:BTAD domain-containing putative transcriptional regulator n=1 Tax=Micromonospora coxensis TaxID=356852 RepID=UPI0034193740
MSGTLRFEILGPQRAWHDDREIDTGPGKQRAVLAVLLLSAGRAVPTGQIVDAVWPDEPPANGPNVVQKYVAGLRRVLEPGRSPRTPGQVVTLTEAGYLLRVPPEAVDAVRFERSVRRAQRSRAEGQVTEAVTELRSALDLWRGEPLSGLSGPFFDSARHRLVELRAAALETRVEWELELGRHRELTGELVELVAGFPLRERLRHQLMLALYRSGRQAEALAAYREIGELLREEYGIEPGNALQELHRRILRSDPALIPPPRPAPADPADPPRPAPDVVADLAHPAPAVVADRAHPAPDVVADPAHPAPAASAGPADLAHSASPAPAVGLDPACPATAPTPAPTASPPPPTHPAPPTPPGPPMTAGPPTAAAPDTAAVPVPRGPAPVPVEASRGPVPVPAEAPPLPGAAKASGPAGWPPAAGVPGLPVPPLLPAGPVAGAVWHAPRWMSVTATVLATMTVLLSFGGLTWAVVLGYAAWRRSWRLALAGLGYLALVGSLFYLAVTSDPDSEPPDGELLYVLSVLAVCWCVGAVHVVLLSRGFRGAVRRALGAADRRGDDDRRVRREQARHLLHHHPAARYELRIGRPDLPRVFDDGGLVDVNAVSDQVLAGLPGLTPDQCRHIVTDRLLRGPYSSVEELAGRCLLPPAVTEHLRDVLVFLPPPGPPPTAP